MSKMRAIGKIRRLGDQLEWARNGILALCDEADAELEREYVAWPKGADGSPIKPGDVVYGEDGLEWHVTDVRHAGDHLVIASSDGCKKALRPEWLSHERKLDLRHTLSQTFGEAMRKASFGPLTCAEAVEWAVKELEPMLQLREG